MHVDIHIYGFKFIFKVYEAYKGTIQGLIFLDFWLILPFKLVNCGRYNFN